MKTRIVAGAVLASLLFLVVLVLPKEVAAVVMGLLQAVAVYELLYRTGLVKKPGLVVISAVMAFAIAIWSFYGAVHAWFVLLVLVFFLVLIGQMMRDHVKIRFETLCMCFLGGLGIPYLMSAVVRILAMNLGRYVILIPFFIACVCDAGAYFVGVFFGKHRLCPVISPKKSVEGFVGGILTAVLGMLLYAFLVQRFAMLQVNYWLCLLYGLLGSVAGVMGDLSMSVIKRQAGIKDYGNLIPGHGGILDRFDSVMITAPLTEALLLLIPFVV